MKKIYALIFQTRFFVVGTCALFCSVNVFSQTPYTWNQTGTASWTVATNWMPNGVPGALDDAIFNNGATTTVTNIPTQSIAKLNVTGNTTVNLQADAASTILTINGTTSVDLLVAAGSALNISTINALTITLGGGATGSITGNMTFTDGQHRLDANDASGIIFNAPAVFTQGINCIGSVFTGGGNPNVIVFSAGTTLTQLAGANPFGLAQPSSKVVFNTGSLLKVQQNTLIGTQGRTYANLEIDFASFNQTLTGATDPVTIDNLIITQGTLNMNLTSPGSGVILKGNLSVAPGATLNFNPATAGNLTFNGTSNQTITNNGTLTFSANTPVIINNTAGITVNSDITLNSLLSFVNGIITVPNPTVLSLGSTSTLAGVSNTGYVNGKVRKIGNTPFVFPVGKPAGGGFAGGYVPIEMSNPINATLADIYTAEYLRGNTGTITALGLLTVSEMDHWTLERTVTNPLATIDLILNWTAESSGNGSPNFITDLPSLVVARKAGADWSTYGPTTTAMGNVIAGQVFWNSVSTPGPFAIGSISFANPLPAIVNYINGTKQGSQNMLHWQVSCINNTEVTMVLERAGADRKYTTVTTLKATAARCQQPFDYGDANPGNGINYYRLKVITPAGKETYSNNIAIINGADGFDIVNLMPNIVTTTAQLNITSAKKTKLNVVITDMAGRPLTTQLYSVIAGSNLLTINAANLSTGMYYVVATTAEGDVKTVKFIKQ
jgi:hypothetical protein